MKVFHENQLFFHIKSEYIEITRCAYSTLKRSQTRPYYNSHTNEV